LSSLKLIQRKLLYKESRLNVHINNYCHVYTANMPKGDYKEKFQYKVVTNISTISNIQDFKKVLYVVTILSNSATKIIGVTPEQP